MYIVYRTMQRQNNNTQYFLFDLFELVYVINYYVIICIIYYVYL